MTVLELPVIGAGPLESSTTRRDTAAAGPIPAGNPTITNRGDTDGQILGHLPANRRTAIPTREHHCGGAPIQRRPGASSSTRTTTTSEVTGRRLAAATPASRSFVLAALRALHLDPGAPPPAHPQLPPNLRYDAPNSHTTTADKKSLTSRSTPLP